jgi:hypothetical protein
MSVGWCNNNKKNKNNNNNNNNNNKQGEKYQFVKDSLRRFKNNLKRVNLQMLKNLH